MKLKAVIPAAGLGTRFLPLTKGQPKEMLPIIDKPIIQYVVEEAVAAGIDDIIIVTGKNKRSIEDHFDRSQELESLSHLHGQGEGLEELEHLMSRVDIHYVRQRSPRGLADAVYCARKHIGDETFAVMLGDVIHRSEVPVISQLAKVHEETGGSVIAVERIPWKDVRRYGILRGTSVRQGLIKVEDMVEKPRREEAPSNIAVAGTYLLSPTIFKCIERTEAGVNGEVQLTDSLRLLLQEEDVYGCVIEGTRYDVGDKIGWMQANLTLTLADPRFSADALRMMQGLLDIYGHGDTPGDATDAMHPVDRPRPPCPTKIS
ncbi:MAG: UTP--glucose-1-phosphate uridylyltransferase GalU [Methanomassiliicoccus sp.]|nr:UTP--glucose-1-phosphate uridylyltransferase GalU [Methanomassiliicoccus sp.]